MVHHLLTLRGKYGCQSAPVSLGHDAGSLGKRVAGPSPPPGRQLAACGPWGRTPSCGGGLRGAPRLHRSHPPAGGPR